MLNWMRTLILCSCLLIVSGCSTRVEPGPMTPEEIREHNENVRRDSWLQILLAIGASIGIAASAS